MAERNIYVGYTFSHLFGSIYDRNIAPAILARASGNGEIPSHICPIGRQCYAQIFQYTLAACILATILSITLGLRRGRALDRGGTESDTGQDWVAE